MFLMQFDTSHHSFQAIGFSKDELAQQLLAYWQQHAQNTGADPDYAQVCLDEGGVDFIPMNFNTVICDGQSENRPFERPANTPRIPIARMMFDSTATPTGNEQILTLGIESLSDIVSHAVQMAVAEHGYRHDRISERDFANVRDEFLEALDAAGALEVDKLDNIGTAPW